MTTTPRVRRTMEPGSRRAWQSAVNSAVCLLVLAMGCSKAPKPGDSTKAAPEKATQTITPQNPTLPTAADPPPPPPPGGGNISAPTLTPPTSETEGGEAASGLAQINGALEQWVFKHNEPPKDLNELVKQGYLKRLPLPPPGKRFFFDVRTMRATLVD